MKVVDRRCCGIDVHKDSVTATILVFGEGQECEVRTRQFGTHGKELQRLAQWLRASQVLRDGGVYRELGGGYYDSLPRARAQSGLIRRLERLGLEVIVRAAQPLITPPLSSEIKRKRGRPYQCLERHIDCKHKRL